MAASLLVTRRIVDPLQRLAAASRRIADGHYAERVPTRSTDELGDLARSFNQMADALEATERRRRELIGDVAHELRTPIATLEGYLEGLLDGVVEPGPPTWARLHDEAGRLRRLVDDLQELSRAEARQIPLTFRPTDPADITRAALERLSPSFADKGLDLRVECAGGLAARAGGRRSRCPGTQQCADQRAALHPAPGTVVLTVRATSGAVQFSACDSGVGIAADDLRTCSSAFIEWTSPTAARLAAPASGSRSRKRWWRAWADACGPTHRAGSGSTITFTLPIV